ncbi:expressed unknown protein [Seminavis robusta]|uniref:Uncharacterized protein n=1 Tax=Seminavis robusta TaxID=568900 RepID=A0A9N8EFU2_9STRA|nr:expressed unknown protein [Seminavis robusta]|eukprot:Sro1124_g243860.1 n/a (349) ;mRNA; r:31429-32475
MAPPDDDAVAINGVMDHQIPPEVLNLNGEAPNNRNVDPMWFQLLEAAAMMPAQHVAANDNEDTANDTESRGRKRKASDEGGPNPRMQLTDQEREWALAIKQAMAEEEEILESAISDMEIAAFAIVDRDDIERSLERAICMQAFRMMYNINDNVDEAIDILRKNNIHHPGCILSIDECPNDDGNGAHVMVADMAKFNPQSVMDDPKGYRILLGGFYYQILATQPDIQSIRDGFRQVIECDGVSWSNISFQLESKKWHELLCFVPMLRKEIKVLRQPSVLACLHSFLRPVMKKSMSDKYTYGLAELDIEYPERIDNFYLQPTPEAALEGMLDRIRRFLTVRYKNERSFRL